MAGNVSLTARRAIYAGQTDEAMVMLFTLTHPSLSAPVRFSSDPTVRLSADPYTRGTRHQGEVYPFVLMAAIVPDDQDKSPPRTTLVFENVTSGMAAAIRSIQSPAEVELRCVLASSPDVIEARYTRLRATRGTYDASKVTLDISKEPWTSEPWPAGRMTADRFPGLH